MENEIIKYNYDIVTITSREIATIGYVKPNDSMIIAIADEMKNDIEQMRNRDDIIRSFIINPDLGYCIGFNFEGKYMRGIKTFWQTKVFYYNPAKAEIQRLLNLSKSRRK